VPPGINETAVWKRAGTMIPRYNYAIIQRPQVSRFYRHKYHLSLSRSCLMKKALKAVNAKDAV
jgi:hypothetical protein